ncbi:predicted protein [Methanosarcina acetivorans C2A]|uniref:Uncharacterized protein n=1 Tax=Methanosarcina acetivorans (strain ATCC 35395 / DSM 2834 / JCM 12185 / C2A) TaxID=188937 RepID=Q8TL60_METAC|nr:predicted protein [Methanosarcina acetivorans C2A]
MISLPFTFSYLKRNVFYFPFIWIDLKVNLKNTFCGVENSNPLNLPGAGQTRFIYIRGRVFISESISEKAVPSIFLLQYNLL